MSEDRDRLVGEAQLILAALGFDGAQTNERSALTLLALLGMQPGMSWADAERPLKGVTPIMQWMAGYYKKVYAPNSRETVRRQTLHQFVDAALVALNPDDPKRPVNSGNSVYQVQARAYELIRTFGTARWHALLDEYLVEAPGLRSTYAAAREQAMIPVTLLDGGEITLTPGGQNALIRVMVEDFCPRWTPGGEVLYVGDAGKDDPIFEEEALAGLGVRLDKHGKFPDLIVYLRDRNWLVLMEAASSHGPVDSKRQGELSEIFRDSTAGLVYVSCFPTRAEMRKYLADIAWESEAWCADAPSHLIHFNGERFLGPYGDRGL